VVSLFLSSTKIRSPLLSTTHAYNLEKDNDTTLHALSQIIFSMGSIEPRTFQYYYSWIP